MRILCIGDSYGLPRFAKSGAEVELYTEETYPEQLRRCFGSAEDLTLVNHCRHANTTFSLASGEADALVFLRAQYAIVQLGLTDLWPSAGRNVEPLQAALRGKDPWVGEAEFHRYLTQFTAFARERNCRVLIVGIPKIAEFWYQKLPQVRERTMRYERICCQLGRDRGCSFLSLARIINEMGDEAAIGSDGIHPTRAVSLRLAQAIAQRMKTDGDVHDGQEQGETGTDR